MTRLRAPARHACWTAAFLAGGPWLWLGSFLLERQPDQSFAFVLERAKLHANLWLLAGGVIWYAAWSFGTLLLPRHAANHRHQRTLHRGLDAAIVLLIPAVVALYWVSGDPDPRHFRRMMPTDAVFLPALMLAALQAVAFIQIWCLERACAATSVPGRECPEDRGPSPAVSAPQRQDRDGWRAWPRPTPPQSARPHRNC
jgi:hypothetical protein